jgi:predicted dehydrogenase/threonine dehydrogenase-like Zn-dependent dehydrogenase
MNQLTQNLKTGKMELLEVPFPVLSNGMILIRNHFSLISAGTEASKVDTARKGYLAKAKAKPDQVKQVISSVRTEGLFSTYNKVMNKLDAPSPLGYSLAGQIIDMASDITDFNIGDLVACGGTSASHAEVIAVPKNLCVKLPENINLEFASYTTVASIAIQGIRQADLRLSESCAVIGLGLIGQLTIQILKAGGIKVAAIDIESKAVELAEKSGADIAVTRNDVTLKNRISELSSGFGVDAVIITAGTSSLDPVELAGSLCRKKGKVVIVGAVPTGFSRPNYYKKELDLVMSCSYGPGRYDSNYEDKGVDYPIGYVRWTENRNMMAFIDLLSAGKINIKILTTHIFEFEDALKAYDMIMERSEPFVGILLKYNHEKVLSKSFINKDIPKTDANNPQIGFIGAGSFAQKYLLPNAQKYGSLIAIMAASGYNTRNIVDKYKFKFGYSDAKDIVNQKEIDTVFIATRHNTHGQFVKLILESGKNIFVEKPLCLNEEELEEIRALYENSNSHLMVGYNRRFSPFIIKILDLLGHETIKAINFRINVGKIAADHWTQDKEIGGGRIIGEVCHFVDLAMFIAGSKPVSLSAVAMNDALSLNDTLCVSVKYANGSIANISYFANGSKELSKEHLEIFSNGVTAVIEDFKQLSIYGKKKKKSNLIQNKGHAEEIKQFLEAVKNGTPTPIPFGEIYLSSKMSFDIIKSIKTKKVIHY